MEKIVNYQKWSAGIPAAITDDALWQTEVYRIGLFMGDLARYDSRKLIQDRSLIALADQLYRATGGISANISEGYSYASGKNQARFYEYVLGSAREARDWYFKSRHQLGKTVVDHRLKLLARIIRQLLGMIPKYRGQSIKEEEAIYETIPLSELLQNIPLPEQ